MIGTSFRTRGVVFAFLIGPPRVVTRKEGMEIHEKVCNALGVEDLSFKYTSGASPEMMQGVVGGWAIQIERTIGRGVLRLTLDCAQNQIGLVQPVRVLMEHTWPPSLENVKEDLDSLYEATFEALGHGWQRVLAEVRVRGQLQAKGDSSVDYLLSSVMRFPKAALSGLTGKPDFLSVGLEIPAGDPTEGDALNQPKREVRVEVLRDDPRSLYLEVMSQWPQVAQLSGNVLELDARRIRTFDAKPSQYLQHGMDFTTDHVIPLFS